MTPGEFMKKNRANMIADIGALVNIKSVKSEPKEGAPYGEGIRAAQQKAMELCREAGFLVHDADGRVAYAHFGPEDRFIGIIAHLDVVPEGEGWDTPPYRCTERGGYLVGRGVGDDKGPFVTALYAMKYLKESGLPLRYGVRLILGLDEESGMSDAEYYARHFPEPVFTFTPDTEFPVCHGEKGILELDLVSGDLGGSAVRTLSGGEASNVVPDHASALLSAGSAERVVSAARGASAEIGKTADGVLLGIKGVSAHAGTPYNGVNAIDGLLRLLLDAGVLNPAERSAAAFLRKVTADCSGKGVGIDCDDGRFTPLTVIAGMIEKVSRAWRMNINVRYPAAVAPETIEKQIEEAAGRAGFSAENIRNMPPFYRDPDSPEIRVLGEVYHRMTGYSAKPYVFSGGTYARKLRNAVAFGAAFPGRKNPKWVGSAHMKNEAARIDDLLLAGEIYAEVLKKLQEISF